VQTLTPSNGVQGPSHATGFARAVRALWLDDGTTAWREWRAYRLAGGALLAVIVLALGLVFFALRGQRVQVMVQVVQHDADGHLVKIGVPIDLLAYEPQDGAVRDMLATWVDKRHWKGEEPSDVRARYDWRWLYLHTCGAARRQLDEAIKHEEPFKRGLARVQVDIDSLPKTLDGYQVLWKKTIIEQTNPQPKVQWWNTTFRVGRVAPQTIAEAAVNNLGLCVTWFDDEQRHDMPTR
jgi:hypothetical protein